MSETSTIRIFGVPMDLGQSRRGVDMGPSAIRYAGLQERLARLGHDVRDGGNILAPQMEEITEPFHASDEIGHAHNLPQVALVCGEIYTLACRSVDAGERVVFLGGDHSISVGSISAISRRESVGVLWVDAHGDINTPLTTPSGNIHGMVVAALLGDGPDELTTIGQPGPKLKPEQVAMIGIRDLDQPEKRVLLNNGVTVYTMRDIDAQGLALSAAEILLAFKHFDHIHVSLDLDCLDPAYAPGVGTPVPGGLTYREAHLLMEILNSSGKVRSLDIVEVNPILDDQNRTAEIAVDLAASLFGERIL